MILRAVRGSHSDHRTSSVFPDGPTETGHNGSTSVARKARTLEHGDPTCTRYPRVANCALCPLRSMYTDLCVPFIRIHDLFLLPRSPHGNTAFCLLFPRFPSILTVSLITGVIRAGRAISARTSLLTQSTRYIQDNRTDRNIIVYASTFLYATF